jgi:putative ABC transport system substrate-binding protein
MRWLRALVLALAWLVTGAGSVIAAGDAPIVGVLSGAAPRTTPWFKAFDARLAELGWVDGDNIEVAFRNPEGKADLMARYADELVALDPAVIVATGPEATLAAVRERAGTIPVVFVAIDYDPVDLGYVESFARPGGTVTGVAAPRRALNAKRLEFLLEAMPQVATIAIFGDHLTGDQAQFFETAVGELGLATKVVEFEDPPYDLAAAVAEVATKADAILTVTSPVLFQQRKELFAAALEHRIPVFFGNGRGAVDGALMGFNASLPILFARAAGYVDRILDGGDPAQLPVEQPTGFHLSISLKTAAALGLELPQSLLLRADEVIE